MAAAATAAEVGSTISCTTGLDPMGRVVSGRRAILEACVRRWITPKGRLGYNLNYGFCVTDYLNDDVSPRDLAVIRNGMVTQALEDDRVLSCEIEIVIPPRGIGKYQFIASLEDAEGPFTGTFLLDADNILRIVEGRV
jgi:hypothetical protein